MRKVRAEVFYAEQRTSSTGGRYWRVGVRKKDGTKVWLNASRLWGSVPGVCDLELSDPQVKKLQAGDGSPAPVRAEDEATALRIARSVALQCAAQIAASRPSEKWSPQVVIDFAQELLTWLLGGPGPTPPDPEEETPEGEVVEF